MSAYSILIPMVTVSVTNQREHWSKRSKRAKAQRQAVYLLTNGMKGMRPPLTVTLTRISPRQLDDDNLRGALKSVRDGVADRLQINDGDKRIQWAYAQIKGLPKVQAVEIKVTRNDGRVRET